MAEDQGRITDHREVLRRLAEGDLLTNGRLVGHFQVFYFISDGREVDTAITHRLEHQTDDLRRQTFEWRARHVSILKPAGDKPDNRDIQRVTAYLEGVRDQRIPPSSENNKRTGGHLERFILMVLLIGFIFACIVWAMGPA